MRGSSCSCLSTGSNRSSACSYQCSKTWAGNKDKSDSRDSSFLFRANHSEHHHFRMRATMRQMAILGIVIAVSLLAGPGCRRGGGFKPYETTFDLTPTVPHALFIDPCKKFEVSFSTKDNIPVSVYVMSKADGEESISASAIKGKSVAMKPDAFNDRVIYNANDLPMAVVFE